MFVFSTKFVTDLQFKKKQDTAHWCKEYTCFVMGSCMATHFEVLQHHLMHSHGCFKVHMQCELIHRH